MELEKRLEKQLQKEQNLITDNGEVKKWVVINYAQNHNESLIELLIEDNVLKEKFFKQIRGHWIFNHKLFVSFMENKNYFNNSYTCYKNKVGLQIGNKYLKQLNEVSLVWPFKDCVLEGGQTKEEQKREEIFFNEILAQDEINQLFEPKVLSKGKRYTMGGAEKIGELKRGEDGTIRENMIIKGNNLLALHSLKKQFRGKVKLIYTDPPYNTGNGSFHYNDSFKHSAWLTFMKNRLDVAFELLQKDGIIFVHCDNNEQAYLKVLMDDMFGRENFIEVITVVNNPRGRDYGGIANMHEFINVYAKSLNYSIYLLFDENKKFPYKDLKGGFEIRELRNRNIAFNDENRPNLYYPFYLNPKKQDESGFYEISLNKRSGWLEVLPAKSQGIQTVWRWGREKAEKNLNKEICGKGMKENGKYQIVEKYRKKTRMARSVWWDKEINSEKGTLHLKRLFKEKIFANPKPEETLKRIIEISTKPSDIILDFCLGSGTTAAAAHKMGRQYIGIEQMDYVEEVSIERLKKVIGKPIKKKEQMFGELDYDKGGISESVDWKGGGSFLYFELKKNNENFIEQIQEAKNTQELLQVWEAMKERSFLDYNLDLKKHEAEIEEFQKLTLEQQKRHLAELLDKNQMYVNLSSLDDVDFKVSKEDKELARKFYQL